MASESSLLPFENTLREFRATMLLIIDEIDMLARTAEAEVNLELDPDQLYELESYNRLQSLIDRSKLNLDDAEQFAFTPALSGSEIRNALEDLKREHSRAWNSYGDLQDFNVLRNWSNSMLELTENFLKNLEQYSEDNAPPAVAEHLKIDTSKAEELLSELDAFTGSDDPDAGNKTKLDVSTEKLNILRHGLSTVIETEKTPKWATFLKRQIRGLLVVMEELEPAAAYVLKAWNGTLRALRKALKALEFGDDEDAEPRN